MLVAAAALLALLAHLFKLCTCLSRPGTRSAALQKKHLNDDQLEATIINPGQRLEEYNTTAAKLAVKLVLWTSNGRIVCWCVHNDSQLPCCISWLIIALPVKFS